MKMAIVVLMVSGMGMMGCSQQVRAKSKAIEAVHVDPPCKDGDTDAWHIEGKPKNDSGSWSLMGNGYREYEPYKCAGGKWILDEEAKAKRDAENAAKELRAKEIIAHRLYLWNSLRTKIVTDLEMKEILELGPKIIPDSEGGGDIHWCENSMHCSLPNDYKEIEYARARDAEMIFNAALLNQFKMRTFAVSKEAQK